MLVEERGETGEGMLAANFHRRGHDLVGGKECGGGSGRIAQQQADVRRLLGLDAGIDP